MVGALDVITPDGASIVYFSSGIPIGWIEDQLRRLEEHRIVFNLEYITDPVECSPTSKEGDSFTVVER